MAWLFNIAYVCLLAAVSPWLLWSAWRKGKYREGFAAKLLGHAPIRSGDEPCIWFHAVSVGEVNLLAPIMSRLARLRPDLVFYISTTTQTGFELANRKYENATVFYAPLDFSWAVGKAFDRVRPDLFVLAELELWPNLIAAASSRTIPVTIINGRLSDGSFRGYRRIRSLLAPTLAKIDFVAAQTPTYADRFRELGVADERVAVTGSIKFDGARSDRSDAAVTRLGALAGISANDLVIVAGSTQHPEEELAYAAWESISQTVANVKLILVPRHPERFNDVASFLKNSGGNWARRSKLDQCETKPAVVLVDAVGELGSWWGLADAGFVGGSMGKRGGQNMIEPAAYGVATCFGPNTKNFRDVVALLLEAEGAKVVHNGDEMRQFFSQCIADETFRRDLGSAAQRVVSQQQGAADATTQHLLSLLPAAEACDQSAHRKAG